MFPDHNGIRLEINKIKIIDNCQYLKINEHIPNNTWVKGEVSREILNILSSSRSAKLINLQPGQKKKKGEREKALSVHIRKE